MNLDIQNDDYKDNFKLLLINKKAKLSISLEEE